MKIGFIGVGNMGFAMLRGIENNSDFKTYFYEKNTTRKNELSKDLKSISVDSIPDLLKKSDVIILTVKPYQYELISNEINTNLRDKHILISVAPSISLNELNLMFNGFGRIIRSMPNTPALVNCGITGIVYDENMFLDAELKAIIEMFKCFGEVERIKESDICAITAIAGSSPAYVDIFIETLADIGVKYGLTRELAYKFASKAVEGSGKLVSETMDHPAVLKDRVCSPGGTTIVAVEALEKYGFRNAIWQAGTACYEKCKNNK